MFNLSTIKDNLDVVKKFIRSLKGRMTALIVSVLNNGRGLRIDTVGMSEFRPRILWARG
jgi:hypothetical protein